MERFKDKIVVITGGTSGIGAGCAAAFAKEGAKVVIAGRSREKGEKIVRENSGFGEIHFEMLDVTEERAIDAFANKISQQYGDIDILFNNAGIYPAFSSLEDTTNKDWDEVFSTNVNGMMAVCRCFMSQLKKTKGVIINNASIAGMQDFTSGSGYAYAASKAAVIKFTKMIAKNYAEFVRINCICPGVIDTPLYLNLNRERMIERIPAGRIGEAGDIASVVTFLASDDAKYIYGAVIPIDGGITL